MDNALLTVVCLEARVDRTRVNRATLTTREWHALLSAASRVSRWVPDQGDLFAVIHDLALRAMRSFQWRLA